MVPEIKIVATVKISMLCDVLIGERGDSVMPPKGAKLHESWSCCRRLGSSLITPFSVTFF